MKGSHTIDEYFQGLTSRFDTLASLGKPIEHDDQIEHILDGLPEDYRPVVDQIEGRDVSPTLAYVHEQRNNSHGRGDYNNNNNKQRYNNNNQWQPSYNKSEQRTPHPYLGRCQICSIQGQSAKRCPQLQNRSPQSAPSLPSPFILWQPRANFAMGAAYDANGWFLDSGATHHMTNDLANLFTNNIMGVTMS
ncbi:hypothetical protein ISN45_Aa02g012490 [Arabidopsis thaliana x Arabidopsis arenosa]|uniref:Uncharacterized protein n=1 Tax=Arabidopsis thaliana x Arabidopsis arenosa TaxID=1240361 RepID=A0A8T2BI49_9BRAS|nr:hypothetical protein ISN45_Aa02g012490 [Arabidopsis thaliana x Arabidopsis arenosa]